MLTIEFTKTFKKSYKKVDFYGKAICMLVLHKIAENEPLEEKYKDHALKGKYKGYRECHLKPDLLLVYKIEKNKLILKCIDIGSHSSLNLC